MNEPIVTGKQLTAIMPRAGGAIGLFIGPLNAAMERYNINTRLRIAAFLATAAHESMQLTQLVENLNYSVRGLLAWSRRFTIGEANTYAHQPEKIANHAYALRMGNGDEASGDGWRYRGRGIFQVTGRALYRRMGMALLLPLEEQPDLLIEPEHAAMSAGLFWDDNRLNRFADKADMRGITLAVTGGMTGYAERVAFFETAGKTLT